MNDTTSVPLTGMTTPVVLPTTGQAWPEFGRLNQPLGGLEGYLRETAALLAQMLGTAWYAWGEYAGGRGALEWRSHDPDLAEADAPVRQRLADPKLSAASFALSQGRPLLVPDFSRETRCEDALWRRRRASSGVFCPLLQGGAPLGVIAALSPRANAFDPALLPGADAIAHLAVATIARARAEEALGREERLNLSLWQTMPALMISLTADGRIERLNRAAEAITGFEPPEIHGRTVWGALLIPEEVAAFRDALERLRRGEAEIHLECYILTKQGDRRRVSWVLAALRNESGACESLVASGIDITEKFAALERLAELTRTLESHGPQSAEPTAGASSAPRPIDPAPDLPDIIDKRRGAERRRAPRRAYPYVQALAPVIDGQLPSRALFREVRCRDISPSGFSYLSPVEPAHKEVVVAFGAGANLLYLKAEVVHHSPTRYNGVNVFHVGCRYLGRVEL